MLAELAAANAAFAVIKKCVQNGQDLANAGSAIAKFVTAKEELKRRSDKKSSRGQVKTDLEEFMALEKIKEQEEQLKQVMIWSGRPGLWKDWQKFQAEARKSRRVQEALAKKKRAELIYTIQLVVVGLFVIGSAIALIAWVIFLKGLR